MNRNEKILSEIKLKLSQLYANLPQQFALENTKYHLKKALDSIDLVENKRKKRLETQQSVVPTMIGFTSLENAKAALKVLDNMLETERKNMNDAIPQELNLLNG